MQDLNNRKNVGNSHQPNKIDDNSIRLWLETAGLTIFMSLVLLVVLGLSNLS